VITCSSGSTWTLLQTSVKSTAVRSLISLWRNDGKPPRGHDSRCSTAKAAPHSQCVGGLVGAQPYRNAKASTKAPLCRQKPCSLMGRDVSQLEAPGWLALRSAPLRSGSAVLPQYFRSPPAIFPLRVRCESVAEQGCENGVFGGEECLSLKMEPRSSRHSSNPCSVLLGVKQFVVAIVCFFFCS